MRFLAPLALVLTACGPKPAPHRPLRPPPKPPQYSLLEVAEELEAVEARGGWSQEVCARAIEKVEHTRPEAPGYEDYLRGVVADRCGQRDRARGHMQRVVKHGQKGIERTSAEVWLVLDALDEQDEGDLPAFAARLERGIADVQFRHAGALLVLSQLQLRLAEKSDHAKLRDQAKKNLRRAIVVAPSLAAPRIALIDFLLAEAGVEQGGATGTHEALAGARKREPAVTEAWFVVQEGAKRFPDDGAMHYAMGRVALAVGEGVQAMLSFEQAVELDPEQADWAIGYGSILLSQRRFQAAATVFRRAEKHSPERYEVLVGLSVALRGTGADLDEARRVVDAAIDGAPERAPAHYEAGLLALASGRNDEAPAHLRRFVELSAAKPRWRMARLRAQQLLEAP